jgi:hypothetical protein
VKTPDQKLYVLNGSLGVLTLGLLGLVPPLGLVLAPLALWRYFAIWSVAGKEWNPARSYLNLGLSFAFLGGFISLVALLVVVAAIINASDS